MRWWERGGSCGRGLSCAKEKGKVHFLNKTRAKNSTKCFFSSPEWFWQWVQLHSAAHHGSPQGVEVYQMLPTAQIANIELLSTGSTGSEESDWLFFLLVFPITFSVLWREIGFRFQTF